MNTSPACGYTKPRFSCLLPDGSKPAALKHAFLKSSIIEFDNLDDTRLFLDGAFWEVHFEDYSSILEQFDEMQQEQVPVIISYQQWEMNGTIRRYAVIRLDTKGG